MKYVKGFISCANTGNKLFFPEIFWLDDEGTLREEKFESSSEGFFELNLPDYVEEVYIRNKVYDSVSVKIPFQRNFFFVKLRKNNRNLDLREEEYETKNKVNCA